MISLVVYDFRWVKQWTLYCITDSADGDAGLQLPADQPQNNIYGDGNQWRDSTCELPDKSFKDMSGMAAELLWLRQSALLSVELCFDCLKFLPSTYLIVWRTGMLFGLAGLLKSCGTG